ncbi:hypothetical protein [Streptomyces sp. NBC_01320]|uniref:hypothetical protein n=1 Tax=Streptomyces sp. NBC_01320 TaxID=2903824 RepID=UPI002E1651BB|nr:hypothetical protein OG395_57220 [Streptomyces sp. NBC_01320]
MGFTDVRLDGLVTLPRYAVADCPMGLLTPDQCRAHGLVRPPGDHAKVDAWLVEERGAGYVHRPLHDLHGLVAVESEDRAAPSWSAVVRDMARKHIALEAKELVARAEYRAGVVADRTLSGRVVRPKGRPYAYGHPLVATVRQTACCGRVSEVAVSSLFDLIAVHHRFRSEPGPTCLPSDHPRTGVDFADVLPELERLFAKRAQGEGVMVWGAQPVLALYAEIKLARPTAKHGDLYWLMGYTYDLQVDEAAWRTGVDGFPDLVAAPVGDDAAQDAAQLVRLVHELAASHRRHMGGAIPQRADTPVGPPITPQYLLPCALGTPGDPPAAVMTVPADLFDGASDAQRHGTVRREQALLRRRLLGGRTAAPCALCGTTYPAPYLRAAHIKRRADASEDERRTAAVGMLACTFGCDQMFELGDIYVDADGVVRARAGLVPNATAVLSAARRLDGRRCEAAGPAQEPFFRYHRESHGHGTPLEPSEPGPTHTLGGGHCVTDAGR